VVLMSRCWHQVARGSSSCTDGGKKAVRRGEHEISRKAIAQGRPGCSACTCMLVCAFLCANCTRDRGCSVHPVFPAPSHFGGQTKQSSGEMRRENAKPYPPSLPATNARRLRKGAKRRSNPSIPALSYGLLRYARNDVDRPQFVAARMSIPAGDHPFREIPGEGQPSGITMSLFEMQMIRQQSDYFFIFPPWLKCNDLISTYDRPRDQLESKRSAGIAVSPTKI